MSSKIAKVLKLFFPGEEKVNYKDRLKSADRTEHAANMTRAVKSPNRIEGRREQSDWYKQQAASAAMERAMIAKKK